MNKPFALGVIGTGHIAGVLIHRLVKSGYYAADRIVASPSRAVRAHPLPVRIAGDNREVVRQAGQLLICVTPQKFSEMARDIADAVRSEHLLISIMAGVPTAVVAAAFPSIPVRVVRCMPNLPFGLGYGVTGVFAGQHAT